jgi:hypothetical protein
MLVRPMRGFVGGFELIGGPRAGRISFIHTRLPVLQAGHRATLSPMVCQRFCQVGKA